MFSDDGQWWWDGAQWIATSQVVIPDVPVADSGGIEMMHGYRQLGTAVYVSGWAGITSRFMGDVSFTLLIPFLLFQRRTFRRYRASMLERLAAATTYLLGDDEPMTAGEVSVYPSFLAGLVGGQLALAITRGHVLVLWINVSTGRPQRVVLVARARDVTITFRWGFLWGYPTLYVYWGGGMWPIRGSWGVLQREPVLTAWREAALG